MAIRLSRRARRDLDDIRRYTVKTWGREQWLAYYGGLVRAFEGIAADPDGGRDRSLFAAGLRSVNYRRHVIFFARIAVAGDEPVIVRIVHQRRSGGGVKESREPRARSSGIRGVRNERRRHTERLAGATTGDGGHHDGDQPAPAR